IVWHSLLSPDWCESTDRLRSGCPPSRDAAATENKKTNAGRGKQPARWSLEMKGLGGLCLALLDSIVPCRRPASLSGLPRQATPALEENQSQIVIAQQAGDDDRVEAVQKPAVAGDEVA